MTEVSKHVVDMIDGDLVLLRHLSRGRKNAVALANTEMEN
jgi:hypothetical protein